VFTNFGRFGITGSLLPAADTGTDDSPDHAPSTWLAIGEDDGEWNTLGEPDRNPTHLTIVTAVVDVLDARTAEDLRGERKVEAARPEVLVALGGVSGIFHRSNLQVYIHSRKHGIRPNDLPFSGEPAA
jgi:hypothetical protein